MEEKLKKNKKKVVLKNYKYDFSSKNDIFELRGKVKPEILIDDKGIKKTAS